MSLGLYQSPQRQWHEEIIEDQKSLEWSTSSNESLPSFFRMLDYAPWLVPNFSAIYISYAMSEGREASRTQNDSVARVIQSTSRTWFSVEFGTRAKLVNSSGRSKVMLNNHLGHRICSAWCSCVPSSGRTAWDIHSRRSSSSETKSCRDRLECYFQVPFVVSNPPVKRVVAAEQQKYLTDTDG